MTSMHVSFEPDPALVATLLCDIDRSLSALISVADQIMYTSVPRHAIPLLFDRIDINARCTEEIMRELRDYPIARSRPGTELAQSLTVVVLVADMVVSGHLAPTSLGDEEVFQRNAIRAKACLADLRAEIDF